MHYRCKCPRWSILFDPFRRERLDAEPGKHLAGYVQTHLQTANTLGEAKALRLSVIQARKFLFS
jgi:hypothetical protein